jgi:hypothetical protein
MFNLIEDINKIFVIEIVSYIMLVSGKIRNVSLKYEKIKVRI